MDIIKIKIVERISAKGTGEIFNLKSIIDGVVKGMYDKICTISELGFCIAEIAKTIGKIRIMLM